jgi:hypothetical protein
MARYKGQHGATMNERNFPHLVEIVIPPGGFGETLDAVCVSDGLLKPAQII